MSALSEALRYMRSEDVPEIRDKAEKALNPLQSICTGCSALKKQIMATRSPTAV